MSHRFTLVSRKQENTDRIKWGDKIWKDDAPRNRKIQDAATHHFTYRTKIKTPERRVKSFCVKLETKRLIVRKRYFTMNDEGS